MWRYFSFNEKLTYILVHLQIPQHEIYRLLNTYCIELSIERISTLINSEEMELHVNDVSYAL